MSAPGGQILTLNVGSSSLKAAIYRCGTTETRLDSVHRTLEPGNDETAMRAVRDWLAAGASPIRVDAVAHRIVHGLDFDGPRILTPDVLTTLQRLQAVDPDHMPRALAVVRSIQRAYPDTPQVACFDTAFHRTMPPPARAYPLPPRLVGADVRRYGFHGLSCEYVVSRLREDDPGAGGRLVIAHLGAGASLTAVHHGRSIETTMGFSPAGGIMMGTRSGDLDPGVLLYAVREQGVSIDELDRLVNREAGLLGVSGTSADMRELLAREAIDPRAAAAVALFCHLARKSLGALVAVLGGLDTLVFTGGIGEHSAPIRERIVDGLDVFGLAIDRTRNDAGERIVSTDSSRAVVRVVATDEELVMARQARRLLEI